MASQRAPERGGVAGSAGVRRMEILPHCAGRKCPAATAYFIADRGSPFLKSDGQALTVVTIAGNGPILSSAQDLSAFTEFDASPPVDASSIAVQAYGKKLQNICDEVLIVPTWDYKLTYTFMGKAKVAESESQKRLIQ